MTSKAEFIKGCNFVEALSSTDDLDNFHTLNASGFYLASSPVNRPSGTATGFVIMICTTTNDTTLQIFIPVNVQKMYMRKYGSGTWTSWTSATFA